MAKYIKTIKFDKEAREKLLKGIDVVAKAVSTTLGPRGRHVAIDITANYDVAPTVLRDGVSVARSINLEDPHEDMGARLLKQAALKTVKDVGDGTTLTTILAHAIINEAANNSLNSMQIKRELEDALPGIIQELKALSKKIETDTEKEQIATISAADPAIGKLVAEALTKVGKDGVLTIEEGKSFETIVDYRKGLEIDRGYISRYFITHEDTQESIIEEPYILFTDKHINYANDILPFLEGFVQKTKSKDLVIIAAGVVEEGLATLVTNKIRGLINVLAIQAPAFGTRQIDQLEDLAALTGGNVLLKDSGRELDTVMVEELGRADKIIAGRDSTVILGGRGKDKVIKDRVASLQKLIDSTETEFDKEIRETRLANLVGKVAVINVGGTTDIELKEKKERVIDAVAATRAAIEEGVVAGGEISLLKLSSEAPEKAETGFSAGEAILRSSLKAPFKKLMENAGIDYVLAYSSLLNKDYPTGVNAVTTEVQDLIEAGIIDPVKVVRSALENAVSVAGMILTTDVLITDIPTEEISQ